MAKYRVRNPGAPGNITTKVIGKGRRGKLVLTIDLGRDLGLSKSGKSLSIATTGGNKPVPEARDIFINLNVFIPIDG